MLSLESAIARRPLPLDELFEGFYHFHRTEKAELAQPFSHADFHPAI
jgi:hypothetical protein